MKRNMRNGTISELYTDDKKSKYSSNPNHILKPAKNLCSYTKALYKRDKHSKLPLLNFLAKFQTQRKSQINNFTILRQTFFWKRLQNL